MGANERNKGGRTRDARGVPATLLDPVTIELLHQPTIIPPATLRRIVEDIAPGEARRRRYTLWLVATGFVLIILANIAYFGLISRNSPWNIVNAGFWVVQATLMFGTPVLAAYVTRAQRRARIGPVMLRHQRCPQCGYDLRGLTPDAADQTTVCPECGAAWRLTNITRTTQVAPPLQASPAALITLILLLVGGFIGLWMVLM